MEILPKMGSIFVRVSNGSNSENGSTAKGLKEVAERLDKMKLNEKDAKAYNKYLKNLLDITSDQHSKMADAEDLINQGISKEEENKETETILKIHDKGMPDQETNKL